MPDEKVFATDGDLGPDESFRELHLPSLDRWVRVRRLSTDEAARLSYLPDLLGFGLLMAKLRDAQDEGGDPEDPIDPGALAAENYRYQGWLAHLAVMRDPNEIDEEMCNECGFAHVPSLWTHRRTARLKHDDLNAIAHVALNADALEGVRPFSKGETPSDSPQPADTGESIQPTSS